VPNIRVTVLDDSSVFINRSIASVREHAMLGGILVILIIFALMAIFAPLIAPGDPSRYRCPAKPASLQRTTGWASSRKVIGSVDAGDHHPRTGHVGDEKGTESHPTTYAK
jgi:ABC-type dipeptide/oligopeptide/nickel transport system permease subunit